MFVIFLAHAPGGNPWDAWIPARFGFSSGAELFVFCSGFASALAFGAVFGQRGFRLGTARVLLRIWQVYWAHIGLCVATFALGFALDRLLPDRGYAGGFAGPLMADPGGAVLGLVGLAWVPPFLDILPMYLVVLALMPTMMAARRLHPALPFILAAALYAAVWTTGLNLPGDPWSGGGWFFNPFAWQLVFYLGFAFAAGWLPAPRLRRPGLVAAASAIVAVSVPVTFWGLTESVPALGEAHRWLLGPDEKTALHPLRLVHFLATAYLALSLVEPWRDKLHQGVGGLLVMVGRQSLAAFLGSMLLARLASVALDLWGREAAAALVVNVLGLAGVAAVAATAGFFKSKPWAVQRQAAPPRTSAEARPAPTSSSRVRERGGAA